VLLKHQLQQFRRQLLQQALRELVHSYLHSLNRELVALNLQSSKYRDAVVVKLNQRQWLNSELLQPMDKPCYQVAVHLRQALRLVQF
jgi:hypothetical protein